MRPVTEITFVGDEDVTFISTHQPNGTFKSRIITANFFYVSSLKPTPAVLTFWRDRETERCIPYIQVVIETKFDNQNKFFNTTYFFMAPFLSIITENNLYKSQAV